MTQGKPEGAAVTVVLVAGAAEGRAEGRAEAGFLRIGLSGRFAVTGPDGADLVPRSAKAQGLVALLATSPDLCRNRRWLEDKLWSDRGREQASASLRQALSEVRRAFADRAEVLTADRQVVRLDRSAVTVEVTDGGEAEFLEGIDVRDAEFEAWLRVERMRRAPVAPVAHLAEQAAPAPVPPPFATPPVWRAAARAHVIVMVRSRQAADALALLEDLFIDCVSLSLREALGVQVFTRRPTPLPPQAIEVTVQATDGGGDRRGLRVRATEIGSGRVLWSGSTGIARAQRLPVEDLETVLFANQLVEALGDELTLRPESGAMVDALAVQRMAVRKMWTLSPARMAEAAELLALADQLDPRGLVKARQAQLRVFQMIERHVADDPAVREEAMACCDQALEREPNNSMVLAVVAYARNALDRDPAASVELARRSVRLNPHNPLAWDSLSIAKLYSGQVAEAHEIALRVQKMGASSPNKFWWDMGLCVTSAMVGQEAAALHMAEISAAQAPNFNAPLRYLVALEAGRGNEAAAAAAAERLARQEPGFSFDRLALDPAYPVGALRRVGLLKADRIRAIGP
jgi:tetratricopeptide (TPR) repeat protein